MANSDEEKKTEITKSKFCQGVNSYTDWAKVKAFIKNSPAVTKTMILENIQTEIDNITGQRDNLSETIDFLINLKTEIEAI